MLSIDNEQTQSLSDIGLSWLPEFQPGIPDQFQPYDGVISAFCKDSG
mgnify:CR=1 FL=1